MPQSLASVYLHATFSTKDRRPFLTSDIRSQMHAYLAEVTKRLDCPAIEIGGVEDHVHLLVRFARTCSIADWMREVKSVSSTFGKQRLSGFAWQNGYGVFSVGTDAVSDVARYVSNQEEHHHRETFKEEFLRLLEAHHLKWDERYIWD